MTDQPDFLAQFSNALAARAEAAKTAVVAIRLAHERHITGMRVAIRDRRRLRAVAAAQGRVRTGRARRRDRDGEGRRARSLHQHRDPEAGEPIAAPSIAAGEARTGAIALAIGADGAGGASARLGLVNLAGPEWHSSRGGLHRPAHRARYQACPSRGGRAGFRRRRRLSRHVDLRAARPGHCHSDRDHRTRRAAARSRTAASRAAGLASPCRPSRCPMRCARPPTSPAG